MVLINHDMALYMFQILMLYHLYQLNGKIEWQENKTGQYFISKKIKTFQRMWIWWCILAFMTPANMISQYCYAKCNNDDKWNDIAATICKPKSMD